jgi:hypothetical protein
MEGNKIKAKTPEEFEATDYNISASEIIPILKTDNSEKLKSILNESRVLVSESFDKPEIALEIKNANDEYEVLGTMGNISTFIGKAKSKKSFLVSIAVSACVGNGLFVDCMRSPLSDSDNVLYFDTEQGRYHVHKALKRICTQTNIENPENLYVFNLRKYSPAERLELIEYAIYELKPKLVVIDGSKDLVNDINFAPECNMVVSKLMKWSEDLNCHIITVLHQNKGDLNARGHLGTELVNKSETVVSVTKLDNSETSIVHAEFCRNKPFADFGFEINEFGIPISSDNIEIKANAPAKKSVPLLDSDTLYVLFKSIFDNKNNLNNKGVISWTQLQTLLKLETSTQLKIDRGLNYASDNLAKAKTEGVIILENGGYILGSQVMKIDSVPDAKSISIQSTLIDEF